MAVTDRLGGRGGGAVDLTGLLSDRDRAVYEAAGYGARAGFGRRPVVLVIDVTYDFCGERPEPILESVRTWRNSCGEAAWAAIEEIGKLLEAARSRRVPVIYTTAPDPGEGPGPGRWADKNRRRDEDGRLRPVPGNAVVAAVRPLAGDLVVRKSKPSAFFGTPLTAVLVDLGADSIIACGTTTSGCVRATVLDGFSHNYRMSVVAGATFDRGELSHLVNLFDMDQKYADVVSLSETTAYLGSLPDDLFPRPQRDGKEGA